jgi:hypothetical protein
MRREKKYPITERVMKAAIRTLTRLEGEGHDANKVLDRAITGCWQGIFPGPETLKQRKRTTITEISQPLETRTEAEKQRLREGIKLVRGGLK